MNMIFKALWKNIFAAGCERISRTIFVCLAVFWGLRISGIQVEIAPGILYLMTGAYSAGMMWQALLSDRNRAKLENLFMLPFEEQSLVFSYVAVLGIHTLLTKTAGLLAVLLAVSAQSGAVILGSFLSAGNGVLAAACVCSRKRWGGLTGICWAGILLAADFALGGTWVMPLILGGSFFAAVLVLGNTDPYLFYFPGRGDRRASGKRRRTGSGARTHGLVWRYLLRYLRAHKNYLVNTAGMWAAACLLPLLFEVVEGRFALPVGFAILSINTPICILLSCDPSLEQAVRFLPGQERAFCIPYGLFLFVCNLIADLIFLCSWEIRRGGIGGRAVGMAALFAAGSAAGSALLEWYFPIRGWKLESDLWHHPRKYVVPAAMLLLAGAAGTLLYIS